MNTIFNIKNSNTAVIFGAGHGIGYALVAKLLELNPNLNIHATYRNEAKAKALFELQKSNSSKITIYQIDPLQENQLKELAQKTGTFDLLINSIGVLHNEKGLQPEKSLKDINIDDLVETFKVNAVITPLIAKYFTPERREHALSAFVSISAKVGSLEDNRMGGWYGYRASKAALNMFLININREFERKKLNTLVMAIHPGTTITELSKPFTGKTNLKLHTPLETATNILNVLENKSLTENGRFYSWDGEVIPW